MKNLTWQNPEQLFVAQELINKVKSKCCGIKDFMEHTQVGDTKYELLDISMKSPKEVADDVINWVHGKVFV